MASRHVIHYDIKPANIAISLERGAVLIDHGVAKTASARRGLMGGSPWYMPPEWLYKQVHDLSEDVWSLGITMLYVLGKWSLQKRKRSTAKVGVPMTWGTSTKSCESCQRLLGWLTDIGERRERLNRADPVDFWSIRYWNQTTN